MTIGELLFFWTVFGIIALIALHKEAKRERERWNRRYNMRRGNYQALKKGRQKNDERGNDQKVK